MLSSKQLLARHAPRTSITPLASGSGGRRLSGSNSPLLLGRKEPMSRGNDGSGKLIMPGQGGEFAQRQQRIVLPDNANTAGSGYGAPTQLNKFRPPQGFMDDNGEVEVIRVDSHVNMTSDQLLQRLSTRQGTWTSQAKIVLSLQSKGVDSTTIFQVAGIPGADQNALMISMTIMDSMRSAADINEGLLKELEVEDGWQRLYPLRFLVTERRSAGAAYIVQNSVAAESCGVLSRAMKEWERRPTEREGFSDHPGDCLAFKYFRDAIEARAMDERRGRVQQGLSVAITTSAKKRLMDLVAERPKEQLEEEKAVVAIARLEPDELVSRPVALLKELGEASVSELQAAPRTKQEGAFNTFTLDGPAVSHKWVPLPMWRALAMARHPVAIAITDCSKVPGIVAGTQCKTDEDRRRLKGAGLLVVDTAATPEPKDADEAACYVIEDEATHAVALVSGSRAASAPKILGTVMFVVRPPHNQFMGAAGPDMLQV